VVRRAVGIPEWRVGGQAEQPAQVRRVLDPRRSRLEQLDGPEGRRGDEVSKLKQELDGDIVVYASYQLVRTLMEHDLVDELRLIVFPVVLGPASASSARPATRKPMRLVDTRTVGDGLAFLTYELVRATPCS
jgi:dihydrofolate reductase